MRKLQITGAAISPTIASRGVEEQSVCFVMRDRNGQALAYVYFEDEPGRRSTTKLLSKDARQ